LAGVTLQQIKDSLPKYRYLTPGVDVWQKFDEAPLAGILTGLDANWQTVPANWLDEKVSITQIGRREIPDEVLENQAWWILASKLLGPNLIRWVANRDYETSRDPEKVKLLGGREHCKEQAFIGDLYSKWLGEQLT
jgi:hypothetical protein